MAGMEQLEINSRSYIVRWANVKSEHTITWSIRPDKRSINFGIFKHPGVGIAFEPKGPVTAYEAPATPGLPADDAQSDSASMRSASSAAADKLRSIGLKLIQWHGTCEANVVTTGNYDVPVGEGGMYALVFDNTFSKQNSKRATFTLLSYPTRSPPQLDHHVSLPREASNGPTSRSREQSRSKKSAPEVPNDVGTPGERQEARPSDGSDGQPAYDAASTKAQFYSGVLQKRRRKKHQGWARRFFALDYSNCTLSYYHDKSRKTLRGAIPLTLAAIGVNSHLRSLCIDSGAEVWHLRATTQKDFDAWKVAFEEAQAAQGVSASTIRSRKNSLQKRSSAPFFDAQEARDWSRVETLTLKLKQSRDVARLLARDTDPKYLPTSQTRPSADRMGSDPLSGWSSASGSPSDTFSHSYFANLDGASDRRPFWKRKASSDKSAQGLSKKGDTSSNTSGDLHQGSTRTTPQTKSFITNKSLVSSVSDLHKGGQMNDSVHERCLALLRDLDTVVEDFNTLLHEKETLDDSMINTVASRHSLDSVDDEFFDAEGGTLPGSQLLDIHEESASGSDHGSEYVTDGEESSDSDAEILSQKRSSLNPEVRRRLSSTNPAFPTSPDNFNPLPHGSVKRRSCINPPRNNPPSLIGFLRKNVGKDLSTISMPVSANEPLSLLQRLAEMLDATTLLDAAAKSSTSATSNADRLLYVTAFAISSLASTRRKERAVRKPFNPMLGETYELVREDRGFRFIAEKVSHRPVRLACQCDSSKGWSLSQSPMPSQKFWGKSAELTTEGRVRVSIHATSDRFSWVPATTFLRNIIAGEKYVEPVGSMTVVNEATGEKCIVQFKAGGMFSGRSESIVAQMYDAQGNATELGLMGHWTSNLAVTVGNAMRPTDNPVWTVNAGYEAGSNGVNGRATPSGVLDYGLPTFAAQLNEITAMELHHLPPTDSRLRPDQQAVEAGQLDKAELTKGKLEDAQRQRRKVMEAEGRAWKPRWFEAVDRRNLPGSFDDEEEVWVLRGGRDGYWECRQRQDWQGVENVFAA